MLRFVRYGGQKKFTKNPRHFPMQNSGANTKKIFTKHFWRGGRVGNPWPCYRGHLGLSGRKLQIEFENGFPGPPGPGAQKVRKIVEKESKIDSKSTIFQLF